jgi:glycosyltransferase involved in cell wall biosynthesis
MTARLAGPSMLALVGDMSGPSLWRVLQPFTMLEQRGYSAAWDFKDAVGIGSIAPFFDGYLLPRMAWNPGQREIAEAWFGALRRAGKFAVYDADDDLFNPALDKRSIELGFAGRKGLADLAAERFERIWTLQQCDGVTVSTRRLATIVRELTDRPVVVVPNAVDIDWFRRVLRTPAPMTKRAVTIGWVGGSRPDRDLGSMARGWAIIAASYPDVGFVVGGYLPGVIRELVPTERLRVVPWLPLERYPEAYRGIDIACCAVSNEPFNRAKSVIKAYEAAVAGAAVVATPTIYGGLIESGRNGFLAESVDEWVASLELLLDKPPLRRRLARRLLAEVERTATLAANLWRWPAAWSAIQQSAAERRRRVVAV